MKIEEEKKIAIFAGTTEGRLLAERLAGSNVRADVFVATEYGKEEIPEAPNLHVYDGRIDENGMEDLFREKRYDLILDATHPFAKAVTANIREAAKKTDTAFLRILRDGGRSRIRVQTLEEIQKMAVDRKNEPVFVDSVCTAVEFLKMTEGPVFVTTGSKELSAFLELPDWETRVYARVLSMPDVVKTCADMGFYGSHLIAMQGPFSEEMNLALLHQTRARYFVTKESGKAGGFEEKLKAAKKAGAVLLVIGRPQERGRSVQEVCHFIESNFGKKEQE